MCHLPASSWRKGKKHFRFELYLFYWYTTRLWIQRQAWLLILVPDINNWGHVTLFVKPRRWTHMVTFVPHCWLCCSCIRVVRVFYSARMLKPKELLLIDFPRTKIHPFWLTENIIMGNSTQDNEIMSFFK